MPAVSRVKKVLMVVMLGLAWLTGPVHAQKGPLSPPDTSSPRATLQSFLADFHEATRRWYRGETPELDDVQLGRALSTLDLRQVPEANQLERSIELAF